MFVKYIVPIVAGLHEQLTNLKPTEKNLLPLSES